MEMAEYTMELRTILGQLYLNNHGSKYNPMPLENLTMEEIVADTWNNVFYSTFPIWDASMRQPLCETILRHYYMREIGMETYQLWRITLNQRMREIMPKYNEIAKAQEAMGSIWDNAIWRKEHSGQYGKAGHTSENGTDSRTDNLEYGHTITGDSTKSGNISGTTSGADGKTSTTTHGHVVDTTGEKGDTGTLTKDYNDHNENTISDATTTTDTTTTDNTDTKNLTDHETNSVNSASINKNMFSDTPQNGLDSVDEGRYLTEYRNVNESGNQTGDRNVTHTGTDTLAGKVDEKGSVGRDVTEEKSHTGQDKETRALVEATAGKETHSGDDKTVDSGTASGTSTQESSETGKVTDKHSGTDARTISGTDSKTGAADESGTDSYIDNYTGFSGDKVDILARFNEMYINVIQLIIGDLADLFMSVY